MYLNVCIYLKVAGTIRDTRRGSEGKAWIFLLGEVRKLGQAESLCSGSGGEGKTQKASHQFLTLISCLCYSVAFSLTEPPMLAAYISTLLGKLPPDPGRCWTLI